MAFDRLHIIVLVVGSLLTGVSIDYGFYLFMQAPAWPGEDYWAKVRRLAKPLLASCLTTVAGFLLLLLSELPFIRQLGVFVAAGLLSALAAALIYFSTVENPFLEARAIRNGQWLPAGVCRGIRRLLIAAWIVALPGLALIKWNDNIRELQSPRRTSRARTRASERSSATRPSRPSTSPTAAALRRHAPRCSSSRHGCTTQAAVACEPSGSARGPDRGGQRPGRRI